MKQTNQQLTDHIHSMHYLKEENDFLKKQVNLLFKTKIVFKF